VGLAGDRALVGHGECGEFVELPLPPVDGLPDSQHRTLDGQDHNVAWDVLAPALNEFFSHPA